MNKSNKELIESIPLDTANLNYIAEKGVINGSLLVYLMRILDEKDKLITNSNEKEFIEVITQIEPDSDWKCKEIRYDFNGFHVNTEITFKTIGADVCLFVKHKEIETGVSIFINKRKGKLKISLENSEMEYFTEERTHKEWYELEQLEKALKLITKTFGKKLNI